MSATERLFLSSDLASKRREVLASARTATAVIRDIDGFTLALVPKRDLDLLIEARSMLLAFLTADGAASSHASTASAFGAFAWMASLDEEDREECLTDLREGLMLLAAGDDAPLHEAIREWSATSRQLADPTRRDILLGTPCADEFVSVEPPV